MTDQSHPHTPTKAGKLIVVSTPIGNLDDLSPRARTALESADLVACEDTRHTGRLLARIGLNCKLLSLHEHNERQRLPRILENLEGGKIVAIVSDAGTPLLSDPGFLLVREAAGRKIPVEAVPGPSAILAALVVSGLPPYPFTFAGFPPPRRGKRKTFLARLANLGHTVVLFESPHRLLATLEDALETFGDREACVARELTKLHEETLRAPISDLLDAFSQREKLKGEYVLVVSGK